MRRKSTLLLGNYYFASDSFPNTLFMKDRYLPQNEEEQKNYKFLKDDRLDTRVVAMIQIQTELFLFANPGNPVTVRRIS